LVLLAALAVAAVAGCRGERFEDPPFHLIPDMQWQPHCLPEGESPLRADGTTLFEDNRCNRLPDPHTVSRGRSRLKTDPAFLAADDAHYRGVDAAGAPVKRVPFEVTKATIDRGHERFNIYCSPCHDKTASGHGLIAQHSGGAFDNIPNLTQEQRLLDAPDGELFQTITNGKGRMPSYAAQVPVDDRWAIITWVRVLQQSQHASQADAAGANIEPAESEAK
jgi:mono/diheme cytochrome c family protein